MGPYMKLQRVGLVFLSLLVLTACSESTPPTVVPSELMSTATPAPTQASAISTIGAKVDAPTPVSTIGAKVDAPTPVSTIGAKVDAPTPVSTIGAKVDAPTPTGLPASSTAVGNTPTESPSLATTITPSDGLLDIDLIDKLIRCAMGKPAMAGKTKCTLEPAIARGLFATGIKPKFPKNTECRDIDDYWAMDYSRKTKREGSYHGGIDLPAPFGTPIYAAANGTVVGKFLGDHNLRGIEIVLRHSPQDTGLPVWTFTQYTHFSEMPSQEVGQRARMGEFLGPTGNTGISIKTGKQSETRRPAIHFGVLYNTNGNYAVMKNLAIIPEDGYWMDPNAFFLVDHPFDTEALKALPDNDKEVPIPVLLDDGNTIPSDTKTVWPYACSKGYAGTTEPKKNPTGHSSGLSSDTAKASAKSASLG